MKITKYAAALAIGLTCFAGQASATSSALAQVSTLKGSVAIEQGGTFAPVSASTTVSAGDRIVSMDGSQAQLKFADGCVVDVKAGSMATVGAQSPCAAQGLVGSSSPMSMSGNYDSWGFWGAFGVFAVGALLIGIYAASVDDDHDPVSP